MIPSGNGSPLYRRAFGIGVFFAATVAIGTSSSSSWANSEIPARGSWLERQWERLQLELQALSSVLVGGRNPLQDSARRASPSPSPLSPEVERERRLFTLAGELRELMQTVYAIPDQKWETTADPGLRAEFASLLDVLDQGASLEGVYNGLAHGDSYRALEKSAAAASAQALEVFARELEAIEKDQPEPRVFEAKDAAPARGFEPLGRDEYVPSGGIAPGGDPGEMKPVRGKSAKEYAGIFVGASVFTLKRVLGDEWIRLAATSAVDRNRLAKQYSTLAERTAGDHVDFGTQARNRGDAKFHYEWALRAPGERVLWEGLCRLHRVLNAKDQER